MTSTCSTCWSREADIELWLMVCPGGSRPNRGPDAHERGRRRHEVGRQSYAFIRHANCHSQFHCCWHSLARSASCRSAHQSGQRLKYPLVPSPCIAAICRACSSEQRACWRRASSRCTSLMASRQPPRRRSWLAGEGIFNFTLLTVGSYVWC